MINKEVSPIERYKKIHGNFDRNNTRELSKYKIWFSKNCGEVKVCINCNTNFINQRNKSGCCSRKCFFEHNANPNGKEKISFKRCTKCRELQPISFYRKDKTKKDGTYSSCNDCYRKRTKCKKIEKVLRIDSGGYPIVNSKRVHRYKMEAFMGRKLLTDEHVHHKNGNKKDFRIDNLEVLSASEHHKLHYHQMELKPHEREKKDIHHKCNVCEKDFTSKSTRSLYCSSKCFTFSRKEYTKNWYEKNK